MEARLENGTATPPATPPTVGEILVNQRNAWAARALDLEIQVALLTQTVETANQRIAELEGKAAATSAPASQEMKGRPNGKSHLSPLEAVDHEGGR